MGNRQGQEQRKHCTHTCLELVMTNNQLIKVSITRGILVPQALD